MKRMLPILIAALATFAFAAPTFAQYTNGGHDETTEDLTAAGSWAAAAVSNPGVVAGTVTGTHLLITEVGIRGLNSATLADSTEFFEIYNPTLATINLSKFYVSDVNGYSALPVTGSIDIAANATDFAFRFPAGASIAPGGVKVVAIDGGRYKRGTGLDADFMLFNAGGATTATLMVDVASNKPGAYPAFGAFTNGGEFLWLFFWNGQCDLVDDVDLVYWGPAGAGANLPVLKTAATCQDGPDAGAATTCYFKDNGNPAGTFGKALTVPGNGAGTRQRNAGETEPTAIGGNGIAPLAPTFTSVASDNNPANVGGKINFTATIVSNAATGTVEFFEGATSLGTVPVVLGSATISVSTLTAGSHLITAVYGGDCNFAASTSPPLKQDVNSPILPTATSLNVSPSKTNCGEKVTLTATVAPPGATGFVTFFDGANSIGTSPVDGLGNAVLSISNLGPGGHSLTAVYSGDGTHSGSTSSAVFHEVNAFVTTTTLSQDQSSTTCGQKFILTAVVTPCCGTGDIEFFDGANSLAIVPLDGNGSASLSVSNLGPGTHSLTAHYHSDPCHQKSDSNKLLHEVTGNPTSLVLSAPAQSNCADKLAMSATVSPVYPGIVTFYDGLAPLGMVSVDINGVAFISIPGGLTPGPHSLTATYASGDPCALPSTSNKVNHLVVGAPTTTTLNADPNPSTCGGKVTLKASVDPATATGEVNFFDGANPIGSATLANGSAELSITTLAAGSHSITAVYKGDACNLSSISNKVNQVVDPSPTVAVLSVADPNSATCLGKVNVKVDVQPADATGEVNFFDGGTPLGSSQLVNGSATLSITLPSGSHSLTAVYKGDACHAASTSNKVTLQVDPNGTATDLTSSPNPSTIGDKVTLKAKVDSLVATGEVNFFDGPNLIGSATLNNGVAELSVTGFAIGTHSLTAVYKGDPCYGGSTSSKIEQVVDGPTAVLLSMFRSDPVSGGIELRWQLTDPQSIVSVGVERALVQTGPWNPVIAETRSEGEVTVATDRSAEAGHTYYYRLVVAIEGGGVSVFGPLSGTAGAGITEFALARIAPNPSKDHASVDFTVARTANVRLSVVDIQGRELTVLASGSYGPGRYHAMWNGQTQRGPAPTGLYFIRYQVPGKSIMGKVVLSR